MQLIACWYQNIGPFLDRSVGLHFFNGAYLIKAPIGSGKSFLFFDGPMFGLYKYSRRPMLHRLAKEGQIQVLFEHFGQTYLICRVITMTKAGGDSVVTRLFRMNNEKLIINNYLDASYGDILNRNVASLEIILKAVLEEIPFKSGVELEATLASLLPPREVIEASSILLQESDNIFEMIPSERINIFKHLFGLLGIDEAKEILADKKKSLAGQRELLADTSQINTQFRSLITGFLGLIEQFDLQGKEFFIQFPSFLQIDDLRLVRESLQIEDFSWKSEEIMTQDIRNLLQSQRDTFIALQASEQQRQQQHQVLLSQKMSLEQQLSGFVTKKQQLQSQIQATDTSKISALQGQKSSLVEQIDSLEKKQDFSLFVASGFSVKNILEASNSIQSQIQRAELLKTKISQKETEKTRLEQQKTDLEFQEQRLTEQQNQISQSLSASQIIHCENCGHANIVKGLSNDALSKQLDHIQLEQKRIEQQQQNTILQLQNLEQQSEDKELESIKVFFGSIPWKLIMDEGKQVQQRQQEVQQIDRALQQFQALLDRMGGQQQELLRVEVQEEEIGKQLSVLNSQLGDFEKDLGLDQQKDFKQDIQTRDGLLKTLDQIDQTNIRIGELVLSTREQLIKVKQLKEQETIIADLYTIYSKELMLVVLQDFLPSLEQAINTNLAQVVDYEIKFELIKKTGDKLELEIFVMDEKGQRQVKSLSGGQKTVLKLVWILSVATMMNSKFLFMDETINNLDTEAIAKVAELIKNFVTYHDMKYYVVTHATQIQEMGIRTKTILVEG